MLTKSLLSLFLLALMLSACQIENRDEINWQYTADKDNPPRVVWNSKTNLEYSKLADQLGFRWLEVTCAAIINRDPYIYIHGRSKTQVIERRETWPPGVVYVDIPVAESIEPHEYWTGIKPADVFCPDFSFNWQDHYTN